MFVFDYLGSMMKKRILIAVFLILLIPNFIFAYDAIVFPTVVIGESPKILLGFSERVSEELKKKGFLILGMDDTLTYIETKNLSIQSIEYDRTLSNEVGEDLGVNYLFFTTIVWNGEFLVFDFHRIDVNKDSYWHRTYYAYTDFLNSLNDDLQKSIVQAYIVNDSFTNKEMIKNPFFQVNSINDYGSYIQILRWMRSHDVANLYLCFGTISRFEISFTERYSNPERVDKYKLYKEILSYVFKDKESIEETGDVVRVVHLGAYNKIFGYVYNEMSSEIGYPYIQTILSDPLNGVIFYGTKEESAIIEGLLSRDQRGRYWHRFVWK